MAIVQLKNIVSRIKDFEDKDNTNLKYYVGGEHFDSRSLTINKRGLIEGSTIGPAFSTKFRPGDVLLMSRNPHLRKAGVVDFEGICSDVSYIIRTNDENVIRQKFIPLLFQSDIFWDFAEKHKKGSTNFFLNWSDFEKFEFDLPDIKKQDELCDVLWFINDTLDSYKEQLRLCDELVKAQFVEMFGDLNKEFTIGEVVCSDISSAKRVFNNKDTIKYIDISSIDNNKNEIVSYTEFLLEKAPYRAQQCVREKDILVSTVRPNLKNVAINKFNFQNMVASSGFCILRCEKCLPEYIFAIVKSDAFTNAMCAMTTGANYPAVRDKDVKNYRIPLPSIEKQQKFSKFVDDLDKSKVALKDSIDALNKIYTNIINTNLG